MFVQPVKDEVYVFLGPICSRKMWVEHFLREGNKAFERRLITLESGDIVLQVGD